MGLFDIFKRPVLQDNVQQTMDIQSVDIVKKKKRVRKKKVKPNVRIIFSEMHKVNKFQNQIEEYYEAGYKLAGGISMHGSSLSATLIKGE